jgi:hypothetical protein
MAKTYIIDNTDTLIDLNKDLKDFEVDIQAEADEPFLFTIVNQSILDDQQGLKFNQTKTLNYKFSETNKPFQNYYLVLRSASDTEVKIKVALDLRPVKNATSIKEEDKLVNMRVNKSSSEMEREMKNEMMANKEFNYSSYSNYAIVVLLCILIIAIIMKKKN